MRKFLKYLVVLALALIVLVTCVACGGINKTMSLTKLFAGANTMSGKEVLTTAEKYNFSEGEKPVSFDHTINALEIESKDANGIAVYDYYLKIQKKVDGVNLFGIFSVSAKAFILPIEYTSIQASAKSAYLTVKKVETVDAIEVTKTGVFNVYKKIMIIELTKDFGDINFDAINNEFYSINDIVFTIKDGAVKEFFQNSYVSFESATNLEYNFYNKVVVVAFGGGENKTFIYYDYNGKLLATYVKLAADGAGLLMASQVMILENGNLFIQNLYAVDENEKKDYDFKSYSQNGVATKVKIEQLLFTSKGKTKKLNLGCVIMADGGANIDFGVTVKKEYSVVVGRKIKNKAIVETSEGMFVAVVDGNMNIKHNVGAVGEMYKISDTTFYSREISGVAKILNNKGKTVLNVGVNDELKFYGDVFVKGGKFKTVFNYQGKQLFADKKIAAIYDFQGAYAFVQLSEDISKYYIANAVDGTLLYIGENFKMADVSNGYYTRLAGEKIEYVSLNGTILFSFDSEAINSKTTKIVEKMFYNSELNQLIILK